MSKGLDANTINDLHMRASKALMLDGVATIVVDAAAVLDLIDELAGTHDRLEQCEEELERREDKAYQLDLAHDRLVSAQIEITELLEERDMHQRKHEAIVEGLQGFVRRHEPGEGD